MKRILSILLGAALMVSLFGCSMPKQETKQTNVLEKNYNAFIEAVEPQFGYDIAVELSTNEKFLSSDLGTRTAGSEAEHEAASFLADKMKEIGLQEVEKQAANCDLWQFNGASLTIGDEVYQVHSYATAPTPKNGITAEILYLNEGTMWDYEGVDVAGKIVLIDINQRDNWWITYPMLEAQLQGAAVVIAANTGGFSQIADDALNAQDICAPTGIPTLSIGLKDSLAIQEKLKEGTVEATVVVDNLVEINGGTTYNVLGKIPGRSSEHQIIVGAHYDMYFQGFQDDNIAAGLVLTMAKAFVESGYVPENDIVFVLHGAEEWGSSNTQYDWTVGAWEMINNVHPEWVGNTLAFINFELPAYEFDTYTSTYSAPEMYKMLDYFANVYDYSPDPVNCFQDGILTEGYQTYTYSDDFSYYAAGVPSTVNGFLLKEDMETVFDFYLNMYHTQYDNPETYNENVMDFNTKYYGALAMYIDQMPALYLDFSSQSERLQNSIDEELMRELGADVDGLNAAIKILDEVSKKITASIEEVNTLYIDAVKRNDEVAMSDLREQGKVLTDKNLSAFKFAQNTLLGLMYERPIVPHEAPQENIRLSQEMISYLKEGNIVSAVDEVAWMINNVLEWYAMYFSEEVIDIQDAMLWSDENKDNLYWGTDKGFVKANVEEATRSLFNRYDEVGGDFSKEIEIYQNAITDQSKVYIEKVDAEVKAINELINLLK